MVKVDFKHTETLLKLSVTGHARSVEAGPDLICASASILAYTLAQCIKFYEENKCLKCTPQIKLEKGDSEIICKPKKDFYEEVAHTYWVAQSGLMLLAHNYPDHIQIVGTDDKS